MGDNKGDKNKRKNEIDFYCTFNNEGKSLEEEVNIIFKDFLIKGSDKYVFWQY